MDTKDITAVRIGLKMTQVQLGQLLGVHPLTVSKWERNQLKPSPHQVAMLQSFMKAKQNWSNIGSIVVEILANDGVALAIFTMLKAAFEKIGEEK